MALEQAMKVTLTKPARSSRAPRSSARWWDERRPGSRLRSLLFLTHPGPSILVTATFVAIATLAGRAAPSATLAVRLVFVMLPIQFAIGIANDVFDRRDDAVGKPYKPLVRGVVPWQAAAAVAAMLSVVGLAVAATINFPTLALSAGGLAAGLAYDVGLRRTLLSGVPWAAGFTLLPLAAFAAAGKLSARLAILIPLAVLLAVALHLANAAPDIAADRAGRRTSLAVLVGPVWSRRIAIAGVALVTAIAASLAAPLGQDVRWVAGAAGLVAIVVAAVSLLRMERPFPALAIGSAVLAITWLAALPS